MPRANKTAPQQTSLELVVSNENNSDLSVDIETQKAQAIAEIQRIDEKADFAIKVVTQSIKTQATVAKGRVLLPLNEVLGNNGEWLKFLAEIDIKKETAQSWINAAKLVEGSKDLVGEEFLFEFGGGALDRIATLPAVIQEAVLEDCVESGKPMGVLDVKELSKQPTTKLAGALERLEEVALRKDDPTRNADQKRRDTESEAKLLDTIEELKSQIAEEKVKREQQQAEQERLADELELLKYDDTAAREQRVKRVSNTLIVGVPQLLSDLQKYVAEKDHYDTKTQKSLDDSLDTLISFLKPLYA